MAIIKQRNTSLPALAALAAALMLLGCLAHAQPSTSSPYTVSFSPIVAAKNMTLELMYNPSNTTAPIAMNLGRIYFAPCGQFTMHSHIGVDEMALAIEGNVVASLADASGSVTTALLTPGQAFTFPNGLVHTLFNPSCNASATTLNVFNAVNPNGVSIAASAWAIAGSSLRAYSNATLTASEEQAQTFFSYDPVCLARCGLGATFGQEPASLPPRTASHTAARRMRAARA